MQNTTSDILEWQNGQPFSKVFGDIYFSQESGLEETRHVFLHHNRLQERWSALRSPVFTIAETGFGTGLNFLCAWQLWRTTAPAHCRLHFVSTEKFPLSREDLTKALALWPELQALSDQLLDQYTCLAPGWRRCSFEEGRVTLTLLIGDASTMLHELRAQVDAWFLDGFAPAKNPEMWQPRLFKEMARLSSAGATFATFTSAGLVRRGLEEADFDVEKVAGYGRKREMLRGIFKGSAVSRQPTPKQAVVIGGGIAGSATAYSLATRGWHVTLIERHANLAVEASGNPQGVLYPRLSGHDIPLSRVAQYGFLHTHALLQRVLQRGTDWDDCGLLQQAFNARESKRCAEVVARHLPADLIYAIDADKATQFTGMAMPHGGLWFPKGGWVHPPALCQALAAHPNITVKTHTEALSLKKTETGSWQIWNDQICLLESETVILAGANETTRFPQVGHLPLTPVRGQISQLPATAESQRLKAVICTEGYISPARNGSHCIGASFDPEDTALETRISDHQQNLAMLHQLSPALLTAFDSPQAQLLEGRVALRCVTPDYLPAVGPLLDADGVIARYSPGSRLSASHLPWHSGLYVNTGHGSKGMLTAPLGGEIIAAHLEGEPMPVDATLARTLDPNRFLLRAQGLKRLIGVWLS
jgi:tRNA 5-methylaminomethyl-2-thiouridine biosynthesis bifunctional protein